MAAALKQDLDIDARLAVGHSGIFEIDVDGKVIASRSPSGFPTERQIIDAVRSATS